MGGDGSGRSLSRGVLGRHSLFEFAGLVFGPLFLGGHRLRDEKVQGVLGDSH